MDKKTLIKVIIAITIIIIIVVGNHIYNEFNYFEKWLICNYNSKYTNYQETISFNYINNTLYEYIREENMSPTESLTLEELVEFFNEERDKIKEYISENFSYEITTDKNQVKIRTYIKTIFYEEFYNSYIEEKGISMESTLEEVQEKLGDEYTCIIKKVR